jgi:hypothetical protein
VFTSAASSSAAEQAVPEADSAAASQAACKHSAAAAAMRAHGTEHVLVVLEHKLECPRCVIEAPDGAVIAKEKVLAASFS